MSSYCIMKKTDFEQISSILSMRSNIAMSFDLSEYAQNKKYFALFTYEKDYQMFSDYNFQYDIYIYDNTHLYGKKQAQDLLNGGYYS